jgi:3-hydroxyisobutyrate dehydrogenase-like beta-hydroxyacid dehydrogenase
MAQRIIDAGYPTVLWARRAETLAPFADTTARPAETPAELASQVDLVAICVVDDNDVSDVIQRSDGVAAGLRPGAMVAIHSTIHPERCVALGEELGAIGVSVIDAPVSGGGIAAAEGRLLVMVGGDDPAFERALPVLSTFGDPVRLLGPLGSGQVAKLVNNLLFTAGLSLAHDAIELGSALGLDAGALTSVLQSGSARSFALDTYTGFRQAGLSAPGLESVARLLRKDVDIAGALAVAHSAPVGRLVEVADELLALLGRPGQRR